MFNYFFCLQDNIGRTAKCQNSSPRTLESGKRGYKIIEWALVNDIKVRSSNATQVTQIDILILATKKLSKMINKWNTSQYENVI